MLIGVFDFESTGIDVKTARITELGFLVYNTESKRVISQYSQFVYDNTYPTLEPIVQEMTKITEADLKKYGDLPSFQLGLLTKAMARVDALCGHNVRRYDLPLLFNEMARIGVGYEFDAHRPVIDTRYDLPFPKHIDTRKLIHLAAEHGLPCQNGHSALDDCKMTLALLQQYNLDEVLALSKSPEIFIRADVPFQDRELAKARKYFWDGDKKWWVKMVKEVNLEQELKDAPFKILKLENYEQK